VCTPQRQTAQRPTGCQPQLASTYSGADLKKRTLQFEPNQVAKSPVQLQYKDAAAGPWTSAFEISVIDKATAPPPERSSQADATLRLRSDAQQRQPGAAAGCPAGRADKLAHR